MIVTIRLGSVFAWKKGVPVRSEKVFRHSVHRYRFLLRQWILMLPREVCPRATQSGFGQKAESGSMSARASSDRKPEEARLTRARFFCFRSFHRFAHTYLARGLPRRLKIPHTPP